MTKTKNAQEDNLIIAPPVPECICAKYMIKIPAGDSHLKNDDSARRYAAGLLEKKLGDEVEINRLKVRSPGLSSRLVAKTLNRTPNAKLYVSVNF